MPDPFVPPNARPGFAISLVMTVALLAAATAALVAGFIRHDSGWVAVSLICTTLSAATLAEFARAIRTARRPGHLSFAGDPVLQGPVCPIDDYERLRVADILPLLQELDAPALRAVAWHEHLGQTRASVLARVTTLLADLHAEQGPPKDPGLDESPSWLASTGSESEQ